ncbi:MAG: hypothetical protein M1831_002986 [Alyxoria varia]|nr:MAG: hypothetical protein M1831_002986 [Alyxoria varia]
MSDPPIPPPSQPDLTALTSALGTLIGYLGAEASTDDPFERLLWPQRFFTFHNPFELLLALFLMHAGGPLHRGAIHALDKLHRNGLFRGPYQNTMLGTVFFRDTGLVYRSASGGGEDGAGLGETKQARNGLWVRAAGAASHINEDWTSPHDTKREGLEAATRRDCIRRKFVVNLVTLRVCDATTCEVDTEPVLQHETGQVSLRNLIAILATESLSVMLACVVTSMWHTPFGLLYFIPLLLKLLAALFTVPREPLQLSQNIITGKPNKQATTHFQIDMPSQQDFLVLSGPSSLIHQFFRHYGHPTPHRLREVLMLILVVLLGLNFFIGLVCSILWMPTDLQYVWLGYQFYATLALFVYRFAGGAGWLTSEKRVAAVFARKAAKGTPTICLARAEDRVVLLQWRRVRVAGYAQGRRMVEDILAGRDDA